MVSISNLYFFVLGLTLFSFILNIKKFSYNQSQLYFLAFVILIVTEVIGNRQHSLGQMNVVTYFVGYDVIYEQIVLFFYYQLLRKKKLVLAVILLHAVFNVIIIAYCSSISESYNSLNINLLDYHKYGNFVNTILFLFVIIQYIYETFNSNVILHFKYYFPFWITVSLLLNFVGHLPIYISLDNAENDIELFGFLNDLINIISYSLLIIGIFLNKDIHREIADS